MMILRSGPVTDEESVPSRLHRRSGTDKWTPPCAAQQAGVFTRAQAMAAGLGRGAVDHRILHGIWRRVAGRGYVLATSPVEFIQAAWAATLTWPDAVLWGPSGLRWHHPGAPVPKTGAIHVAVPYSRCRQPRMVAHRCPWQCQRRVMRQGIAVVPPADAVADTFARLAPGEAASLAAWLVTRDLINANELAAALAARRGRPGVARIAHLLRLVDAGAASFMELDTHQMLREGGLTGWKPNVPIWIEGSLVAKADAFFERAGLIIESDGFAYHGDQRAFENDRARDALLLTHGLTTMRLTYKRLTQERSEVIREIRDTVVRMTRR